MSLTSSPLREMTDLMKRKNLANVPKDQQKLLEREDAWAVEAKSHPEPTYNVPAHVLETVKVAYKARHRVKEPSTPAKASSKAATLTPEPLPPRSRSASSKPGVANESPVKSPELGRPDIQTQVSSPGELIPWSPSVHSGSPAATQQDAVESPAVVLETPKALTMAPPPRPSSIRRRTPLAFENTDSGMEDELEMELPQAQMHQDAPVNRAAARLQEATSSPVSSERGRRPMDTPPCAQQTQPSQPVIIPNTVVQEPTGREQAVPPRKRRMKELNFDEPPRKARPTLERMPATKIFNNEITSSTSTASSSIVPATMLTQTPVIESVEDLIEDHRVESETHIETHISSEMVATPQPSRMQTQTPVSQAFSRYSRASSQVVIIGGDTTPFDAFCNAYPTYTSEFSGTLWFFVKACVCLDYLRREKKLKDCLWDDFIRAFADGYQDYVMNTRSDQEPLAAIEWYNDLPGRSLFNRFVIKRENIGYILDYYPEEVKEVRRVLTMAKDLEDDESVIEEYPPRFIPWSGSPAWSTRGPEAVEARIKTSSTVASTPIPTYSSQLKGPLTQAPPSTRPRHLASSAIPSSSFAPMALKKRPTRVSWPLSRVTSSYTTKSPPRRRTAEERARLREHFKMRGVEPQRVQKRT